MHTCPNLCPPGVTFNLGSGGGGVSPVVTIGGGVGSYSSRVDDRLQTCSRSLPPPRRRTCQHAAGVGAGVAARPWARRHVGGGRHGKGKGGPDRGAKRRTAAACLCRWTIPVFPPPESQSKQNNKTPTTKTNESCTQGQDFVSLLDCQWPLVNVCFAFLCWPFFLFFVGLPVA